MNKMFFRSAFVATLPVLVGYLALGMAFGVLFSRLNLAVPWAGLMSLTIYGGSMQLAGVSMLREHMPLLQIAALSVVINIRHVVYGLSLLGKFKGGGWRSLYMIFALTDETYALLTGCPIPHGADRHKYMFAISILNHSYWIAGGLIGAAAGTLLDFDSTGIEFSMTAIFVVILTDLCREKRNRMPAVLGLSATAGSFLIFGASGMLVPAMIAILGGLLAMRRRIGRLYPEMEADE
ncbi:MAG: AzlC family ABC transporter permease [Victivallaceae bacterium]|nr:AzlC family ABC transporter permease [Victivallaceae bacterium]